MATKQPFTYDGANAKVKELYALRDTDLQSEATLLRTNFKTWIANNFALDDKQSAYLTSDISQEFIDAAVPDIATCISHRLKMTFIFPTTPIPTDSSKFVRTEPQINPTNDPKLGFQVQGNMTIIMGYH